MKIISILFISMFGHSVSAQTEQQEITQLEQRIALQDQQIQTLRDEIQMQTASLRREIDRYAPHFLVLFLFGGICALWAQNTGRNAWLWFFAGMIFSVITVVILLSINNEENKH